MTRTLVVEHLARIEGHAGITVRLDGRELKDVRFDVIEGMRLFEGLVVGRHITEVPGIVSRICAICSHGHALTAFRAIERALGITVSGQTRQLRELVFHGSAIESHALHAFCLAFPDFLGCASVIELARIDPDTVARALRLKKLGNTIQEVIGGRAVHPVNYVIGGFGKLPDVDELLRLRDDLSTGLEDCAALAPVLARIQVPSYAEDSIRFAAIVPDPGSYFFGETVATEDGGCIRVDDYREFTKERAVPHSTARHSMSERPYMVGSLARLAVNGALIDGRARELWSTLGPRPPLKNVIMNDLAQVIELVYSIEHALGIVNGLLDAGLEPEGPVSYTPRAAVAASASEVPRGTLFHEYRIDDAGRVTGADVITPTAQNCAHVEQQFGATIRRAGEPSDADLTRCLEIVARAYDPCVSCSVHVIRME